MLVPISATMKKRTEFSIRFFQRYKFLAEFAIYLWYDILLCNAICPFGTRKGIYIISQSNEVRLYRICKANISHEHERVYRLKIYCIYYVAERRKKWHLWGCHFLYVNLKERSFSLFIIIFIFNRRYAVYLFKCIGKIVYILETTPIGDFCNAIGCSN